MTTQYFHSQVNDIIPFQATYTWPSQSTKVRKQLVKLVPKNKTSFKAGEKIEIEFPSDGYLNTQNSRLVFDLTIKPGNNSAMYELVDVKPTSDAVWPLKIESTAYASAPVNSFAGFVLVIPDNGKGHGVHILKVIESEGEAAANNVPAHCKLKVRDFVTGGPVSPELKNIAGTAEAAKAYMIVGARLGPSGVHDLFEEEEVIYGGTQLEHIRHRNILMRGLHEIATNGAHKASYGQMAEGRQSFHHVEGDDVFFDTSMPAELMSMWRACHTYRYSTSMASGLFNCNKLIPLKWLAAQWKLSLKTASNVDALITTRALRDIGVSYEISNVYFHAELIQFPETFDTAFFVGLNNGGVPIKFTTWRHHHQNITGSVNHVQIHERARSIKSAFAWITDQRRSQSMDITRSYHDINDIPEAVTYTVAADHPSSLNWRGVTYLNTSVAPVISYQYRVGGTYFPPQPVDCRNGAIEPYNELVKTLDGMNDFTFAHDMVPEKWDAALPSLVTLGHGRGQKFCMALQFENSDVMPDTITGISGEEQSDLALQVTFQNAPLPTSYKTLNVFLNVDSMIIVEAGNTVKLIM